MRRLRTISAVSIVAAAFVVAGGLAWAATVKGNVNFKASFVQTISSGVPQAYGIPQELDLNLSYSNGTGSNQVDTWYAKSLTLSAAPTTLDLTSIVDPSGATVNFARAREFIVINPDTTAGHDVNIYKGASNGWAVLPASTGPLPCRYSGMSRISDPVSTGANNGNVVTSTSKMVVLDPGSNTITIYVMIVGGSAA